MKPINQSLYLKPSKQEAMEARTILVGARDLISDPSRHTRGAYSRDKNGKDIDRTDCESVRWCAVGAIEHVADISNTDAYYAKRMLYDACMYRFGINILSVNDDLTHSELMEVFNIAVDSAKDTDE